MFSCRKLSHAPENLGAPLLKLYQEFLVETGEPIAAAALVLAQIQVQSAPATGASPASYGLVALNDAADYLGYKPAGLRKLAKQGLIRYVQNGRGPIRFRREWLDEFVAANNPVAIKRSPAQRRVPPAATPRPVGNDFGFDPRLRRRKPAA